MPPEKIPYTYVRVVSRVCTLGYPGTKTGLFRSFSSMGIRVSLENVPYVS